MKLLNSQQFSNRVLAWFTKFGRKNLPWQKPNTPYRVWVSEIMLQQTQVTTVIPYFERFIKHFPDLKTLAEANIDDVLAHWAGLGYYARARNLHRTAQIIMKTYKGKFPQTLAAIQELPGIGRSTAGAILSLSMNIRAPILDGNVKRVLARFHAVTGWPGNAEVSEQLWEFAERYTPKQQVAEYTQAMMDLGATICTRSKPSCSLCPLQSHCQAYLQGTPSAYPTAKPTKQIPTKTIHMLLLNNQQGEIMLIKRPPVGIWGGLWSLPECPVDTNIHLWCQQHYFCNIATVQTWPSLRHTFSHFHLDIIPVLISVSEWRPPVMESDSTVWYNVAEINTRGVAAPVKQLLTQFAENKQLCLELSTAKNYKKKRKV